jgi:ribA/ribD-fused uncharacterized protein
VEAKQLGWITPDYDDDAWLARRESVMEKAVRAKFTQHDGLREILLATGDALLVEDAPDDRFWGVVDGEGKNSMGKILMMLRTELASAD